MTKLRNILAIGIILVAALAVSACLETETNLGEGAPVAATLAWSSDGSEIAFVFHPDSGNRDIYVLDVPAASAIAGVVNE